MEEKEKKKVYAPMPCGHCGGARCTYCGKRGYVMVAQPARKCRHCDGDGCIYCGYVGWEDFLREEGGFCGIL